MIRLMFFLSLAAILLSSCSGGSDAGKNELRDSIAKLEAALFSSPELSVTADKANQIIMLYSRFVNENPGDSISPTYLFKAAEMFRAVNNGKMAVEYYQRVINEYPDHEKSSVSVFLQGFVYENILNDLTKAAELYQTYLNKYPQGEFAKDASVLIQNLGKSPEEMIKEFEALNDTTNKAI